MRKPGTGQASIKEAGWRGQMPECAAHTNVQRALHALILEDNIGAAGYLRRALCYLEGGEGGIKNKNTGKRGCFSLSQGDSSI